MEPTISTKRMPHFAVVVVDFGTLHYMLLFLRLRILMFALLGTSVAAFGPTG
jgi:hypothetical protein